MTAIVGILNKKAIAVASDSAVTLSLNNKTINTADKIFTLSKFQPVGIMFYNNASFMHTPIEVLVKHYRDFVQRDNVFPALEDYANGFISYLKNSDDFSPAEISKYHIDNKTNEILVAIETMYHKQINAQQQVDGNTERLVFEDVLNTVEQNIRDMLDSQDFESDDSEYNHQNVESISTQLIHNELDSSYQDNSIDLPDFWNEYNDRILSFVILWLQTIDENDYTGLFIYGYGETEIFPRLIHYKVYNRLSTFLAYEKIQNHYVTHINNAFVVPGAQTDVIYTILTGSSSKVQDYHAQKLEEFGRELIQHINGNNPTTAPQETYLNQLMEEYKKSLTDWTRKEYIEKLMMTVSYLDKKDLAEMAESLIYTTYLNRRVTSSEESVGGNVDVAIVSKSDGFVWIKRKHYFPKELNYTFYDKYFGL